MDASDFLKKEIPYINYVRDIKDAHVIIISSSQRTGSGGRQYTYFLEGQHKYKGVNDTISYSSMPDDTQNGIRDAEARLLKQGLMKYVIHTPLAKYIDIRFSQPIEDVVSSDKWNSWVFRTSINGFTFGQKSSNMINAFGGFSASKITSDWKIDLDLDYSFGQDKFIIGDETIISKNISKSADALIVKSLNPNWSLGGSAEVSSSTFSNHDLQIEIMPGIEYNIFPYSESTRRQFRFLYSIGYVFNNYTDTTIYNKTEESLWAHKLSAAFEVIQKWGSIDISAIWKNYLHDWSKNNFSVNGAINLRVTKGLSINLGGDISLIHDQLALVMGGASAEEILLRRKELATQFMYFSNFGFTYTFGSIYNNVVNPRFGGGGGRTIIIN